MRGLAIIPHGFAVLARWVRRLLAVLWAQLRGIVALLRELAGWGERRDTTRDRGCIGLPSRIRARPEPYIYSQQWLDRRGLAVTWDNPDFRIVDPDTGGPVNSHALLASKRYRIEATIHNASLMAALGTKVAFEVRGFGVGTPALEQLGATVIDVPAAGSSVATVEWLTPKTAGHNCLRATISHHDDANPMNNVGQHNTNVAAPASPERMLAFTIGLPPGRRDETLRVTVDGYELPAEPRCAGSTEERRSRAYRDRVQREHDPARFPVAARLAPRLLVGESLLEFEQAAVKMQSPRWVTDDPVASWPTAGRASTSLIHPGGQLEARLVVDPPPSDGGDRVLNVNVFDANRLLGGVTAHVEEA